MYQRVLLLVLPGATPEIKYFIVKYLQVYGVSAPLDSKVKELAATLGVTDRTVSSSLNFLVENGYIHKVNWITGKGRPRGRYSWTEKLQTLMRDQKAGRPVHHTERIDDLLVPDKQRAESEKWHPLNTSNKLLLAVLLSLSDQFGVVKGIGISELRGLACMTLDRYQSQIEKLQKSKFIFYYVSGGSYTHLFGVASGVYFLDIYGLFIKKAVFSKKKCISINFPEYDLAEKVFVLAGKLLPEKVNWRLVRLDWIDNELRILGLNSFLATDFLKIVKFFADGGNSALVEQFQLKLEEYAVDLVVAGIKRPPEFDEVLMTRIITEIFPARCGVTVESIKNSTGGRDDTALVLAVFVYLLALQIAKDMESFCIQLNIGQLKDGCVITRPGLTGIKLLAIDYFSSRDWIDLNNNKLCPPPIS